MSRMRLQADWANEDPPPTWLPRENKAQRKFAETQTRPSEEDWDILETKKFRIASRLGASEITLVEPFSTGQHEFYVCLYDRYAHWLKYIEWRLFFALGRGDDDYNKEIEAIISEHFIKK